MEGLEDRLGLWLRRMSTAPTTSESMATNKASVAYTETNIFEAITYNLDNNNTEKVMFCACIASP